MAETTDRELLQKAIECYLSAIISFTDCMADICPEVGVPFRNQWRRLPQRIGFDSSIESLEKSRRTFEASLESLRLLAGAYLGEGLSTVRQIAENGGRAIDLVLDRNAANSSHMASLAESLAATADLGAPPELRDQLEHHSAGLRTSSRRVETEMIPALAEMQRLVKACQGVIEVTRRGNVTDPATGLFNANGFLKELEHQLKRGPACVVVVDLTATDSKGSPCETRVLEKLHGALAVRITEPFRAFDSLARLGPARFAVLFAGTAEQAEGRRSGIARSISGQYASASGKTMVRAEVHVLQVPSVEAGQELVDHANQVELTPA